MKSTIKYPLSFISICLTLLFCAPAHAQDHIVTVSGSVIKANVKKVKTNEIIYRKLFRKHTIPAEKVLYIQYNNGAKTIINPITTAKNYKNFSQLAKNQPAPQGMDTLSKKFTLPANQKHFIERIGSNFRIDSNQLVGYGTINDLVSQNPNPTVQLNLKAAKLMRTFCTISKIASFPSSASGGFASYTTIKNLSDQLKASTATFKNYLAAGLSFVATLSLPITSGILQHLQKKLYDKALITYSMGN